MLIAAAPMSLALLAVLIWLLPAGSVDNRVIERGSIRGADGKSASGASPVAGAGIRQATYDNLLEMATELIDDNHPEGAITWLQKAVAIFPDRAESFYLMGEALLIGHHFRDARNYFIKALDRNQSHADAYFGFGQASDALGDRDSTLYGMRGYLRSAGQNASPSKALYATTRIGELESAHPTRQHP
jgi:predicted Zn-dependent protease